MTEESVSRLQSRGLSMMSLWCVGLSIACVTQPPAASAAAAKPQEEAIPAESESAATGQGTESTQLPSALLLVEAVAAQVASRWKTEAAIAQEVVLSVRFRVDGMSAVVLGNELGGQVITGLEGANSPVDMVVELSMEDANAIANAGSDLHAVKAAGTIKTDNDQGLDRFLQFIDDV